ncbi:MAG: AMP-binding protein [Acetobacter sp.]|nr:AMP-binding protein [Bacteroides sp.]MCM1340794.1 AMP-binding protein [Acetobacter sp.]MCM1432649.1 AMP-binding protein [Clostridiales bacterium]
MLEKEFKCILDKKLFLSIKSKILDLKMVEQINYYYDTKDLSLHKKGITIRIREIENSFKLQYKSNAIIRNNIFTREEKEITINNVPYQINPFLFGINNIDNTLSCLGNMKTIRYTTIENGVRICIDENHYLGIIDYELELECNDEQLIKNWLHKYLDIYDNKRHIGSKYQRWINQFKNCTTYDLYTRFEKIANKNPDKAIIDKNGLEIKYDELLEETITFSNYLMYQYADKLSLNEPIGIFMDKSYKQIVTMLAALRIGIPFLPIDTNYPIERIKYLITNSNTKIIICDINFKIDDLKLTSILYNDVINSSNNRPRIIPKNNINNIAYIIYTSGSTGSPKGVVIRQEAILNTLLWRIKYYNLNSHDTALQMLSISFDSSIEDIFCSLLSGGCLVLIDQKKKLNIKYLVALIKQYNVTYFLTVPSYYKYLLDKLDNNNSLTKVILAGEVFYKDLVEEHFFVLKGTKLYNEYGPTENSVCTTVSEIVNSEEITIGKPIDNVLIKILNKDSQGIGELAITGPGLFDGYLNDINLTKEKTLYSEGLRWYLTGDLVKYDKNKNLIYIGREDCQLKINGKKFNLTEIDKILMDLSEINFSKSIHQRFNNINTIITFIKFTTNKKIVKSEIINYLKQYLPNDELPHKICFINKIPLLNNGKVDINELKKQFKEGEKNE